MKSAIVSLIVWLLEVFVGDFFDYHMNMETLEIVEKEPPGYIKILVRKIKIE